VCLVRLEQQLMVLPRAMAAGTAAARAAKPTPPIGSGAFPAAGGAIGAQPAFGAQGQAALGLPIPAFWLRSGCTATAFKTHGLCPQVLPPLSALPPPPQVVPPLLALPPPPQVLPPLLALPPPPPQVVPPLLALPPPIGRSARPVLSPGFFF